MFDLFKANRLIQFYMVQYKGLNIHLTENIRDGFVELFIECRKTHSTAMHRFDTYNGNAFAKINIAIIDFLARGGYESDTSEV